MNNSKVYCGFINIVGRPNVGKSTLLNKLLGQKISITSRKVNTTRHQIIGVLTKNEYQAIYIDTPGIEMGEKYTTNYLINKMKNDLIINTNKIIIFVIESTIWTSNDERILNKLKESGTSVILTINKIDNLQRKSDLLPHLRFLANKMNFIDIIPISAKNEININTVSSIVYKYLPESVHYFPAEYITNCSSSFMASEIVREKLIRLLGDELPYTTDVKIEQFQDKRKYKYNSYDINGLIFVKHKRQKKIVIGNRGAKIRAISLKARKDMERIFKVPVQLKLWVKTRPNRII